MNFRRGKCVFGALNIITTDLISQKYFFYDLRFLFRLHPGESATPEEIKEFCKSQVFSSSLQNCTHTMFAKSTSLMQGTPLRFARLGSNITLILSVYEPV